MGLTASDSCVSEKEIISSSDKKSQNADSCESPQNCQIKKQNSVFIFSFWKFSKKFFFHFSTWRQAANERQVPDPTWRQPTNGRRGCGCSQHDVIWSHNGTRPAQITFGLNYRVYIHSCIYVYIVYTYICAYTYINVYIV